jgi:hypothetical protein
LLLSNRVPGHRGHRSGFVGVRNRPRLIPARVTTDWDLSQVLGSKGDGLNRRDFITLLGGAAAAWPIAAWAKQAEPMRRIGVLMGYPEGDPQAQANVTALVQGLQSLGWIEGRNVQIDYRWAGGDPDKLVLLPES